MRRVKNFSVAVLVVFALWAAWVRLAPTDPGVWHVDPREVTAPETDNYALLRGDDAARFALPPAELAARLDAIARDWPRTRLLAGSVGEGWMTYETRSPWMAFPDYTSVVVEPAEGGARLAAFARARYGESDFGVNAERLEAWIGALRAGTN